MLKQPVGAKAIIVPAQMVCDGIKADAFDGDAPFPGAHDIARNLGEPARASVPLGAGLCNQHRATIPAVGFKQQI